MLNVTVFNLYYKVQNEVYKSEIILTGKLMTDYFVSMIHFKYTWKQNVLFLSFYYNDSKIYFYKVNPICVKLSDRWCGSSKLNIILKITLPSTKGYCICKCT